MGQVVLSLGLVDYQSLIRELRAAHRVCTLAGTDASAARLAYLADLLQSPLNVTTGAPLSHVIPSAL